MAAVGSEDGLSYSQERRMLRMARLDAEDEAERAQHNASRHVEKRMLEEEIRLNNKKRKRSR